MDTDDRATGQTEPRAPDSDSSKGPLAVLIWPLTFGVFCILFLVVKMNTRRSAKTSEDDTVARISALPTSLFAGGEEAGTHSGVPSTECALCLEEYAEGDLMRHLSCGHTFHQRCIDIWLLRQQRNQVRTCPLCKGDPLEPARAVTPSSVELASQPSAAGSSAS